MTNFLKTLVVVSLFGASVGVKGASLVNGTLSPSGGGSSATLSPGQSNQVIVLINNNAPTNGGITAAQAATQIASTNNTIIQPSISTKVSTNDSRVLALSNTNSTFSGTSLGSLSNPFFNEWCQTFDMEGGTMFLNASTKLFFESSYIDNPTDGQLLFHIEGIGSPITMGLSHLGTRNIESDVFVGTHFEDLSGNGLAFDGSGNSFITNVTAIGTFKGNGSGITNLVPVPATGHTNVVLEKADGSLTTNDIANIGSGGGGGSSFPLSSSVSAGGHSITNLNSLQTSTLSYSYLSPFTNWTFVVCIGDSRGVTPSAATNWPTWLAQNVLVKVPYYAGLTNLCVSGQTLEQESNLWSSLYSTFTPGGGTNVLIIFSGGFNDVFFGTNSAQSVASQNYLFASAKTSGDIVCGVAPWVGGAADGGTTYEQDFNPLQMNTRTNQNIDYRVDFGDTWDTVTANEYTSDGTHPNDMGIIKIAMYVWDALLQPAGYLGRMSEETHLPGFTRISMQTATHTDGGLSIAAQMMADFPGWELISLGGGGGRSIGIQIGSAWDIYTAPASGNFAAAFQFGTVSNSSSLPLYAPKITAPTNNAPHTLVSSAGLHRLALNQGWTNDLGARADIILSVITTNSSQFFPVLVFTNTTSSECYTDTVLIGVSATNTFHITYPDISPGDFGSLSNYGSVGTVQIVGANWKLK